MKKIRKIVALALATVMMMAMSITAFAAETNSTIKVANLEKNAVVRAYAIATVNYTTNELEFADWVKENGKVTAIDLTKDGLMTPDEVATITKAFQAEEENLTPISAKADDNGVATLSVPAGYYFVKANGTETVYNSMVVKAFAPDSNGTYRDTVVEQNAKGEPNEVNKEVTSYKDGFVDAGEAVSFKISVKIPENVVEYKVFDEATNLTEFTNVVVTVGGEEVDVTATVANNKYTWDFSSIVADHYGDEIVITYDSTVNGTTGYLNQVYDSTPGSEKKDVEGFTAELLLTKTDEDGNAIKNNPATFNISRTVVINDEGTTEDQDLYFVEISDGVYKLSVDTTEANRTRDIVTDANGQAKLTGLDEGIYHFVETVAPQGFSINTNIPDKEITDDTTGAVDRVVSYTHSVSDSDLIKLPFTGGMGTTIFTVLGVAIMAMASALYFATKKKATK